MRNNGIKYMSSEFAVKGLEENGNFRGYASVFDIVDNQRDVILKGAFKRTIRDRGDAIKLLWQHKADEPIGSFTALMEDTRGLYAEGQLLLELQRGREAYALLKTGVLKGLSIGYAVTKADFNSETGIRLIKEIDLFEISLVTFPANEDAVIFAVKEDFTALRGSIDRAIGVLLGF